MSRQRASEKTAEWKTYKQDLIVLLGALSFLSLPFTFTEVIRLGKMPTKAMEALSLWLYLSIEKSTRTFEDFFYSCQDTNED